MPYLTFEKTKDNKKHLVPISIVKGDNKKYHNKFLFLDPRQTKKGQTKVELPLDCQFNLIPSTDPDKREVWYIAGMSGSGKSYLAKQLAENYKKLYPEREIYIISKLEQDDTLDSMNFGKDNKYKPIRLDYTQFVGNQPDINQLSNSLIIFDDIDTIQGKAGEAVHNLAEDIAIMGRKHHGGQGNITMLFLTHYLTNYKKTRLLLNEATNFIFYPQNTSAHSLRYVLMTHIGMDKEDVKKLKKMGRWVAIKKGYPSYLIGSNEARLLFVD